MPEWGTFGEALAMISIAVIVGGLLTAIVVSLGIAVVEAARKSRR